jgi:hypothetical protein
MNKNPTARRNILFTHIVLVGMALTASLILSACGGGSGQVNPLPTPLPAEEVGSQAQAGAMDTPEGTWSNYLRDIIAEQVAQRVSKINLLERYQNPAITRQNLGGLVRNILLVEDRTTFTISGGAASATTDFDIRLEYANGDVETRTCSFPVRLEKDAASGIWYVLNPEALQIFSVCQP